MEQASKRAKGAGKAKEKTLIEKVAFLTSSAAINELLNEASPADAEEARSLMVTNHHERLSDIEHKARKQGERLVTAEKGIAQAAKRLNAIEPHKVEKKFNEMAGRIAYLGDQLALLITKQTAATEIPWLVSRIRTGREGKPLSDERRRGFANLANAAVIRALDYPDAWWDEHGNRPMGELLDALLAAYEKDVWSEYPAGPDNKAIGDHDWLDGKVSPGEDEQDGPER